MCYGHYGLTNEATGLLRQHCDQLALWRQVLTAEMPRYDQDDFLASCLTQLLQEDPLLASYREMDALIQAREKGFLFNSIRGFTGYLKTVADQA
jgi:hypothetical protein